MDRDFGIRRIALIVALAASLLTACSSGKKSPNSSASAPPPPPAATSVSIRVNWASSPEVDVNRAGGGYRVYYSKSPNVSTSSGTYVDVPYVSGATAPTTALLTNLTVGTYYVKVVAYSAFNPYGISGGNQSAGSTEMSITIP